MALTRTQREQTRSTRISNADTYVADGHPVAGTVRDSDATLGHITARRLLQCDCMKTDNFGITVGLSTICGHN